MASLFFVVAAMIEFSIVLLAKRNPRCEGLGAQKVSGNEITEKKIPQEIQGIKVEANKRKIFTENASPWRSCPEDILHAENSLFNAKEQHVNGQSTGFGGDADLKDSRCFLPYSKEIDVVAVVLFPTVYLVFNIIYWSLVL